MTPFCVLFSAELELSELKQHYLNSHVKLFKALGGGWITKKEMNIGVVKATQNND